MFKLLTPKFGDEKTTNLLVKYNYQLKTNDILAGTIVGLEKNQILVDVGLGQVAFLPIEETFVKTIQNINQILQKNRVGEFLILYSKEGLTILSMRRLSYIKLWERFKQIDFKNMILYTSYEKTIFRAKVFNFEGLQIYTPNHHLPKFYRKIHKKEKQIEVKVLEVKEKKHTVVASTRLAILKKQNPSLTIGLIQTGCVLIVKPFGLFLNIYGIKCLLHISEISTQKIGNISKLYKKGDQIKVKIIYINDRQGKIAVSAKI